MEAKKAQTEKNILLVEDEALIALNEASLLERNGYTVDTVYNAERALAAVQEKDFDLILMDIDLGRDEITGTEAAESILRDHDLPIVFLSSHTEPEIVEKTEGITSYGYIVKNSGDTVLLASIRMAFKLYEAKAREKEKDEALTISEYRYHNLFDQASDAIFINEISSDKIIDVNQKACELTGYTREQLLTMTVSDLQAPEVRREPGSATRFELNNFHEQYFEAVNIHRDGTRIPVEVSTRKLDDIHHNLVISIVRDISGRKEYEEALRKSEERYRGFIENFQGIAYLGDMNFQPRFFQGTIEQITGYTAEEFTNCAVNWFDLVHPDDAAFLLKSAEKMRSIPRFSDEREYRIKRKDGEISWVKEDITNVCGSDDVPQWVYGTITDITDFKMSEARQKSLLEAIPDMFFLLDSQGTYIDFKRDSSSILTIPPEKFIGKRVSEILPPEIADQIMFHLRKASETHEIQLFEHEMAVGNKTYFFETRMTEVDKNNFVSIVRDITGRKEAEAKLFTVIEEKDYLMKELNHRVKNNLLMVSSLINLKDSSLGGIVDLSDISSQIDTIRILHEKLYQSDDISHIEIRGYIQELLSMVFSFNPRKIKIDKSIENVSLSTHTAISVGLIINEIATNSIKHGFSHASDPRFSAELHTDHSDNCYTLILSNNGEAFPPDISLDNPDTLGLRLVSVLVAQIEGTIELQRTPHPVFTIRFPVEKPEATRHGVVPTRF